MTLNIMLIEDDLIEKMKFEKIVSSFKVPISVITKDNGEEALEYLENHDHPSVILLDLNMPKMNGIEFLEHMINDHELRHIPIVVLTTSRNEKDLKKCYALGIAGYVLKPLKYEDYVTSITRVIDYWMINELI